MRNSKIIQILISIAVITALVIILILTHQGNDIKNQKPIVKIGVTLPLTGDVSRLGESVKNSILLAKSELPAATNKYDYQFIFEDDMFKPSVGVTTANKLINIDKVSVLISFGSPVGNVISPIAEKSHITHVNDFASAATVADGEYNFVHYTPAYEDSKLFISELQKRGIKKIVFFGIADNPGATAIIDSFEKDIKNTDIQVLSTQKFNSGTRDFRTQIGSVKNLNPDIYVLETTSPELEILTKQMREAGIKTPVTTMECFEFSDQLSLFEGMWYVNGADPQSWFVDMYRKAYNEDPKFGAANGYDAVNLIVQATEKAGDGKTIPSSTMIRDVLAQTKGFNGAVGKNLSMDTNGLVISKAVVRIIRDGKPVTIEK